MSTAQYLVLAALIGYAIYRQTRVNKLSGRGRFTLAVIYMVAGVACGLDFGHDIASWLLLLIGIAASVVTGVVRSRLTRLWRGADGEVYSQGTATTVAIFLGLIAFKFLLGAIAYMANLSYDSGIGDVLLSLGVMVAVQAELIWRRSANLAPTSPLSAAMSR